MWHHLCVTPSNTRHIQTTRSKGNPAPNPTPRVKDTQKAVTQGILRCQVWRNPPGSKTHRPHPKTTRISGVRQTRATYTGL